MKSFFVVPPPKNLKDLAKKISMQNVNIGQHELRAKVEIAVIDDEHFQPLVNLNNHGFKLIHLPDIAGISLIADYQVVLCDLQGVGRFLNPTDQGAHVIREIKTQFPEKYVLAYTGGAANSGITRLGNQFADSYIKKDADIATWQDKLDRAIEEVSNPVIVWKKFRTRLLDKYDLNLIDVMQFENTYVKLCLSNDNVPLEKAMRSAVTQTSPYSNSRAIDEFLGSPALKLAIQLARIYAGV
jgi:hypothetical protein